MSPHSPISWFCVITDDRTIRLSVSPPSRSAWEAAIPWTSIIQVCFAAEGPLESDGLYIFTNLRPESWAVPVEAAGGADLLTELIQRGLFDAGLAITAAQATCGLFCWPASDPPAVS